MDSTGTGRIVALLLETADGALRLLVEPDWIAVVELDDRSYLGELLEDFEDRSRLDRVALWRHLAQLSVGPVRAAHVGDITTDTAFLRDHCGRFRLFVPGQG